MTNRPELTFDGKGINGPDEYRERIATFTQQSFLNGTAKKYAPLFVAAPELLEAAKIALVQLGEHKDGMGAAHYHATNILQAAIAKAESK